MRYIDPTGHSVDCALGEQYCQAGKLNVTKRANDLYLNKKFKDKRSSETTPWYQLTDEERSILAEGKWDEGGFNDNGDVSKADPLHDPAVYVSVAFGGWGSGLFKTSFWGATAACLGNVICSTVTGMIGGASANATSQTVGSNPDAGVTVLGYTEDLAYYENVEVNMLQNVPNYTWEGTNVPFLDQAIARGDTIVLISDYAQYPLRTFPKEVLYIQNYPNVIDMFLHK